MRILDQAFFQSFSFKWCSHKVVLTRLQLDRIPLLLPTRSYFYMVDNQSIAVHALLTWLLRLPFVDEMVQRRYGLVNELTSSVDESKIEKCDKKWTFLTNWSEEFMEKERCSISNISSSAKRMILRL